MFPCYGFFIIAKIVLKVVQKYRHIEASGWYQEEA